MDVIEVSTEKIMSCITSTKDTFFVQTDYCDCKTCKRCVKREENRLEYLRVKEAKLVAEQERQDVLRHQEEARKKCEWERQAPKRARLQEENREKTAEYLRKFN